MGWSTDFDLLSERFVFINKQRVGFLFSAATCSRGTRAPSVFSASFIVSNSEGYLALPTQTLPGLNADSINACRTRQKWAGNGL